MKILKYCLYIALFFPTIDAFSQYQLGVRLENYAGINGASLNATHTLDYPLRWNLNLVGNGFFLDNNYGYISNSTLFSLIKNEKPVEFAPTAKGNLPLNTPTADFYKNNKNAFLLFQNVVNGPALSVKIGKNHAIGAFYNLKIIGSATKADPSLRFYELDSKKLDETINISTFGIAMMAYTEVGINYAFRRETMNGFWQMGGNFKYLNGKEAVFARANTNFEAARRLGDSLKVVVPNVSVGFTTANFDVARNGTYQQQTLGTGFALDLGFAYIIENDDYDNYGLRLSAAVNDIGSVRFNKKSEEHLITFDNQRIIDVRGFEDVKEPEQAIKLLSYQTSGDSLKTKITDAFSIGTPTTLCLQADYQFFENAFANATLIQRVPYQKTGVRTANVLAVSARYEHRWFSVIFPIQIQEYQRVRCGFAARAACLTVGTDNLGSLVGKSNFTGTDLYFALKVNPTHLGFGRLGWFEGMGKRNKQVKCYKF
jgi:Family of unknown function (DUF5723)